MEELKSYKLSEVANLSTGFPFDGSKYSKSGIRVVRGDNVTIGSLRWDSDKLKCWSEPFSRAEEYSLQDGDIVIGMDGSRVGRNRAQISQSDLPLLLAQRVACIRHNEKSVQDYLYYLIFNERFVEYVKSVQTGTSIPHISLKQIGDFEVHLPSIERQKSICCVLKSLDEKIALNNRINHNLEEQAKHYFDEWCRGCDDEKSIAELSFNILDYSQNQRDKVILLNSSDVTEGIFEALPYVENKDLKGQFKKRFRKGDILYSEIRPRNHHYAICYFEAEDYIASTRLMIIRRNPELLSSDALLYQYLLMPRVEEEFTSKTESRSGTFPQGNYEDLSASVVPYSRENQVISDTLDSLYSIIWLNMEENKRLASFRDDLLPMLMSGDLTC